MTLAEHAVRCRWRREVVRQEDHRLARFEILEADATQVRRIVPAAFVAIQRDGLIANDAGTPVGARGVDAASIHIRLGSRHEESAGPMQCVKEFEIQIAAIHDVNCPGLDLAPNAYELKSAAKQPIVVPEIA